MTFEAYEESDQGGTPIELYEFTVGQNVYYYTSADADFEYLTRTYVSTQLSHTEVEETTEMARNGITVTAPRDFPIALLFQPVPPSYVIMLSIFAIHRTDPDAERQVVWMGRVLNSEQRGIEAVMTCENSHTSMKQPGLRMRYSRPCQYALYDEYTCKAPRVPVLTLAFSAVDGVTYSHIDMAGLAAGILAGGYIEWEYETGSYERRGIRYHDGSNIIVSHEIPNFDSGMSVKIFAGCRHNSQSCNDDHNNLPNFGGYEYLPRINPFGGNAVY